MSIEAWISLATVIIVFLALAATRIAPDAIMMAALVFLLSLGILTPAQALNGFANLGVMTIAALYVVASGLKEAGAML